MNSDLSELWVYLSAKPLLWLSATLVAYAFGDAASRRANRNALANPVVIAAAMLSALLLTTGTSYANYFEGAQFVHFMLGPATVALAVPLFNNLGKVRRALVPMACALVAGSVTASLSAVAFAWWFGAPSQIIASLAPKSVTAPVAMELAKTVGGLPSLTAVLVVLTGITGALIVTPLMNALRIRDFAARGFAAGTASHGLGTARAFQVSELAGTFAGIAMGLNAALTSLLFLLWISFFGN